MSTLGELSQDTEFAGKNNLAASVAPVVGNDGTQGYEVGSQWIDTVAKKEFVCLDISTGAAVWTETTGGGGGGIPKQVVAWTLNGISSTTNTSFVSVPYQIQIPTAAEMGGTSIEAIMIVSYNTAGAGTPTGEFRLFNYTDSTVEGFVTACPNGTWLKATSTQASITGGKAYRPQIRKVIGAGGASMQIESATLILIVT